MTATARITKRTQLDRQGRLQASSAIRLEFIGENGGGPGVRLRKREQKKS